MPVGDKWLVPVKPNFSWSVSSRFTCFAVASVCKIWMGILNKTTVYNRERLIKAIDNRADGKGLVTVSNHVSCIDDPLLWGMLNWKHVFNNTNIRWTPAAVDVCFTKMWHAKFFQWGRVIPLCRGEGVYQQCMDFCVEKLKTQDWIHMFPEGKINMTKEYMRLKWGVGRLVGDSEITPVVLPLFHIGLDDVLPNKKPYIPQIMKKITVFVGSPIELEGDIRMMKRQKKSPMEIRKFVTDKIQAELKVLRQKAESLHGTAYNGNCITGTES